MRNDLHKLAKNLKVLRKNLASDEVEELAKSLETSETKTPLVKDLMQENDYMDHPHDSVRDGLKGMLAYIRAMQSWFHGAHHVTGGEGFSGDHVSLYTKIYDGLSDHFDATAEKAIGLTDESAACPIEVLQNASKIISKFNSPCDLSAVEIARNGLNIVLKFLKFLDLLYSNLDKQGELTLGLDDFIMAMSNDFETYAYLLKQRSTDAKSGDKRSKV
jgi:DNA-binding ferritin-like protein